MPIPGQIGPSAPLNSIRQFTGTGAQVNWEFSFTDGYINRSYVKVTVISAAGVKTHPAFTFTGDYTINIKPAVAAGSELFIYRDTPRSAPLVDFQDAAIINEANLDLNARQAIHVAAETADRASGAFNDLDARSVKVPVGEVAPTLLPAAQRANKFMAFGPNGEVVASTGGGADGALRADLGAPTGAGLVKVMDGRTVEQALAGVNVLPIRAVTIADFTADNAPIINAALLVSDVMLPPGVIELNQPVQIPANRRLVGSGRTRTTLKAKSTFTYTGGVNNAVVMSDTKAGACVSDLTVDVSKVGWTLALGFGVRVNGIWHKNSTDYFVERVTIRNASGYACWPSGTANGPTQDALQTKRGVYRDIQSYNSNVHFEIMRTQDITLDGLIYGDGDGDIPCEAAVHPIVFNTRTTIRNVKGRGKGIGLNTVTSGSIVGASNEVDISSCKFTSTNSFGGYIEGQDKPTSITATTCKFISEATDGFQAGGNQTVINGDNNEYRGSSSIGPAGGFVVGGGVTGRSVNSLAQGSSSFSGASGYGASSDQVYYFDGTTRGIGTNGASASAMGSPFVICSPTTVFDPAPRQQVRFDERVSGVVSSNIVSITMTRPCLESDKAFLDLSLYRGSALGAIWSYDWDVLEGTPWITIRTNGLPNGSVVRGTFTEIY